jgi:nucleotide-binding universal stress UspA family protein
MSGFQRILFPADCSPRCIGAIPYVKEMVRSYHAKLTVLHVAEIPLYWYGLIPPDGPAAWEFLEDIYRKAQDRLTDFAGEHFNDLGKETAVEALCGKGDPGYAILAHAEKSDASLIMMPTHGYGPFRSFLVGSATARVLHRAQCPVWTGAHLENDASPLHASIDTIICAVDLEKETHHVIECAVRLGHKFSAAVRLVHCVPVPENDPADGFGSTFDRFLANYARERLVKVQERAGTDFDVFIEGGNVAKVVRDAATRYRADLVVIGRGHVHCPMSRLRTNAYAIIRDSPCPVLSV